MANGTRSRTGTKKETSRPVYSRKYWTGSGQLEVTIWSRMIGEGDGEREVFNTTLKKTFKDGEEFKESGSYRPEELPLIAFALQEAFSWISSAMSRE